MRMVGDLRIRRGGGRGDHTLLDPCGDTDTSQGVIKPATGQCHVGAVVDVQDRDLHGPIVHLPVWWKVKGLS